MVYIFGNSHERVPIKDLGDVIYYRQKKQYSDQEFQKSRDLQREIQKGRIVKLDQQPEIRNSIPDKLEQSDPKRSQNTGMDIHDIRKVVTEVVSECQPKGNDTREILMGLIPLITDTVREEISKIPAQQVIVGQTGGVSAGSKDFGPGYVPEVDIGTLKSSITIEGKNVDGDGVSNSLDLLKKFKST